jgi:phosphoglucomutase
MSRVGTPFGVDNWRGIIGEDFTFARVRLAAAAMAHLARKRGKSPALLVAADTRFFSEDFARAAAAALDAEGVRAVLADRPTPTGAVSFEIRRRKLAGGIHVADGSRPAEYSALKFYGPEGAPFGPEEGREIDRLAETLVEKSGEAGLAEDARVETIDPSPAYLARLAELVRLAAKRRARPCFSWDATHGAAAGWLDRLLAASGVSVEVLHADRDVLFGGRSTDLSPAHLGPLAHAVRQSGAWLGFATDVDGGRYALLDGQGRYVSPNHFLGLLYDYLIDTRGWRLGAARTVATSRLVDAVARRHGLAVLETPVGFPHLARLFLDADVALAGDENAGLTIRGHVPQRDGVLACLLAAEMVAERGPLEDQLARLFEKVGAEFWPVRHDVALDDARRRRLAAWLETDPREFLGRRVVRTGHVDGMELDFESGSWLLVRPSGTEPLLRIYAEAGTLEEANALAKETEQWMLKTCN